MFGSRNRRTRTKSRKDRRNYAPRLTNSWLRHCESRLDRKLMYSDATINARAHSCTVLVVSIWNRMPAATVPPTNCRPLKRQSGISIRPIRNSVCISR